MVTFSKTVNYIHKLVSAPKRSILKFNGLGNIHIFKFAFGCLVFTSYCLQNAHNAFSDNLIFKISLGACPHFPLKAHAPAARLLCLVVGSHPPQKNLPTGLFLFLFCPFCSLLMLTCFFFFLQWTVKTTTKPKTVTVNKQQKLNFEDGKILLKTS